MHMNKQYIVAGQQTFCRTQLPRNLRLIDDAMFNAILHHDQLVFVRENSFTNQF